MSPRHSAPLESRPVPESLRAFPRQSQAIAAGLAVLVVVSVYGVVFAKGHAITAADLSVDQALSRLHVHWVTSIARGIYWFISPVQAVVVTAALALIIWWRSKTFRIALTFAVVVGVSWLSSDLLKMVVHRARPAAYALAHPFLPTPPDPSFPSGHAVFAASIAMTFVLLARHRRFVGWVIAAGVVGFAAVALAVLYLGVHYPSDVIGSLVWSFGATIVVLGLWNRLVVSRLF